MLLGGARPLLSRTLLDGTGSFEANISSSINGTGTANFVFSASALGHISIVYGTASATFTVSAAGTGSRELNMVPGFIPIR